MLKKLKVCFVTEDFYPSFIGGQGIMGFNLVSQLAKAGVDVTVLAEKRKGRKKFWQGKKNIRIFLAPFCFGNQLLLALLEYLVFFFKLRKQRFDIVHANQISGLFFVLLKPKSVQTLVVSIHNTNFDFREETKDFFKKVVYLPLIFLEKLTYENANILLFHSQQERKGVSSYYSIKKSGLVYLGTNPLKFSKREKILAETEVRKSLGIPASAKIALCITRLVKRKKVDNFVKAMAYLYRQKSGVYGVVIGDGGEMERLIAKKPPNVFFLGFLPYEQTRRYYLASDCFVLTSVAEGGVSLAANDAASAGLPLVLSPSAANEPVFKEGVSGYTAEADNPKELANKIKKVLTKRKKMGEVAGRLAKTYSWEKTVREMVTFYNSLL